MTTQRPITIATDFSGINAPVYALEKMGIKYKLIFSCDNDNLCKQQILAQNPPVCFFDDITDKKTRFNHFPPPEYIDIYVASMPCQPYSGLTEYNTLEEKKNRIKSNTDLMKHVSATVKRLLPKVVLFENVALFKREKDYTRLINIMKRLKYDVYSEILNSKDYGTPQLRKRVYIVCISRNTVKKTEAFEYPPPHIQKNKNIAVIAKCKSTNVTTNASLSESFRLFLNQHEEDLKGHYYINLASALRHHTCPSDKNNVGCLTTNCASLWNILQNRFATVDELLMLQGFDPKKFNQVVTNRQLSKQIGNSMTISVLEAIYRSIFNYVQF